MASEPVTCLVEATYEHLHGVVGRVFVTHDLAGRRVELELVSVTDMRPRTRPGAGESPVPVGPRKLGLLFRSASRHHLPDGLYDVAMRWLELPGLRLSPLEVGPAADDGVVYYEAVID